MTESTPSAPRPAAPPPPPITDLSLTDDLKNTINQAMENGTPMVVAYVDGEGQPSMSMRGSVQAYSDDKLAIWVRNPEGGMLNALEANPRISTFYRDPATRTMIITRGRAHPDGDDMARKQVYENSPEPEQKADPDRKGVAVIVDLDGVDGRSPSGSFSMRRGGA